MLCQQVLRNARMAQRAAEFVKRSPGLLPGKPPNQQPWLPGQQRPSAFQATAAISGSRDPDRGGSWFRRTVGIVGPGSWTLSIQAIGIRAWIRSVSVVGPAHGMAGVVSLVARRRYEGHRCDLLTLPANDEHDGSGAKRLKARCSVMVAAGS